MQTILRLQIAKPKYNGGFLQDDIPWSYLLTDILVSLSCLQDAVITFCTHMYRYDMTQGPLIEALAFFSQLRGHSRLHICICPWRRVMAGRQHQHIQPWLDKNFVIVDSYLMNRTDSQERSRQST